MAQRKANKTIKPKVAAVTSAKVHNEVEPDAPSNLPIDFKGTAFTSSHGQQYIPFFAPNDNLFRYLLELRLLSPTQSNCINDKTFYTLGDGLQVKDQEFPKDFDKKINGKGQTIDAVLKACTDSYFQDGNKFVEIARMDIGGLKFVHVYPHNNLDCRLEDNPDGDDPTHVLRSKEFRRDGYYSYKKDDANKPLRIPIWNDNPMSTYKVWEKFGNVERTMIHLKNEFQGIDYYGLPSNFPGNTNARLEFRSTTFNLDNFDNNMFLGGILMIQGNLSTDEEKKVTRNIRRMYTGRGQNQRILPISSEGGITDSKFIPFNEQHDGHFMEFDKHNEDKIISANSWSKELLDMKDSSGLGKGGEYLKQLFTIKFRTVIRPAQETIMNNLVFPLMKIIDEYKGTKFYDLPWELRSVIPVSLEGILDINSLLTVDEGRLEIGKKELEDKEKGKKLITEVKAKVPAPGEGPDDSKKPKK